jgi:hypothetical protein
MAVYGPTTEIQEKLEMLVDEDKEVQHKLNEEEYTNFSLNHMMTRMKKDFIASKIKTSGNENALKNRKSVIDFEGSKSRKTKEDRLQSRTTFINLMKNIESEQRNRQEIIQELQTCITLKEASIQKRLERQRRNLEIAEAAANENKDSNEIQLREKLLVQKLWDVYLRKKMDMEMAKSNKINDAYRQIKTDTVVSDV